MASVCTTLQVWLRVRVSYRVWWERIGKNERARITLLGYFTALRKVGGFTGRAAAAAAVCVAPRRDGSAPNGARLSAVALAAVTPRDARRGCDIAKIEAWGEWQRAELRVMARLWEVGWHSRGCGDAARRGHGAMRAAGGGRVGRCGGIAIGTNACTVRHPSCSVPCTRSDAGRGEGAAPLLVPVSWGRVCPWRGPAP